MPNSRELELANGGHQSALLIDREGGYQEIPAGAPPLGVLDEIEFPYEQVALGSGALYLYTDGFSESLGPDQLQLEEDGVRRMLESASTEQASVRLERVVEQWRLQGYTSHDDLTMMVIECVD